MYNSSKHIDASLVIPIYNAENYLRECLDSVLVQTCRDIELILVDDGSTDGSGVICDEYAAFDSRIKVFHNTNSGANASRRFGTFKATGNFVYFIDADDTIAPDTIETALFLAVGGVDVVSMEEKEDLVCSAVEYGQRLLHWSAVHVWGKLFRRSVLTDEWVFDIPKEITVAEDLITNLRTVRNIKGKVVISSAHKYNYRIVQGSMAHSGRITPEYDWKVLQQVTKVVEGTPFDLKEAFVHFRISILRHLICGHYKFDKNWAGCLKIDSEPYSLDHMQTMVISAIDNPLYRPLIRFIVLKRKVVGRVKRWKHTKTPKQLSK